MSAIEDMLLKFTSGNDVAVQRAVVTLDEWRATYAEYMALQARVAELAAALQQQVAVADNANKLNSDLCSRAFSLEQERDELRRRVDALSCELCGGHGMLGSPGTTESASHGECCPDCAGSGINQARIARIKAEAVREAKKNIVIAGMHRGNLYDQGFIDAIDAYDEQMEKYANQIEGGA